jgi:hypothetical protein
MKLFSIKMINMATLVWQLYEIFTHGRQCGDSGGPPMDAQVVWQFPRGNCRPLVAPSDSDGCSVDQGTERGITRRQM